MRYDNSSLQAFKDCPERYRLQYIEGLKKREEGYESIDKVWGKAIHSGMETLYKGGERNIKKSLESFRSALPDMPFTEDKVKTKENGEKLLQAYAKHYEAEDKHWEVLECEESHTFRMDGGFPFTVKRDMVVKLQGNIFAVEHKTTKSALNWNYWMRYEPNSQITAQVYSTILKYGQCSGVILNALKVGFRERKYKGEEAGFHCEFQRQVFNRNKEQVEDWKEQTKEWLMRLNDTKVWLKNEGACYWCQYKEICNTLGDEGVVEQLYERINPFQYLEDNKGEIHSSGLGEA